jgi:hypothetical protein
MHRGVFEVVRFASTSSTTVRLGGIVYRGLGDRRGLSYVYPLDAEAGGITLHFKKNIFLEANSTW